MSVEIGEEGRARELGRVFLDLTERVESTVLPVLPPFVVDPSSRLEKEQTELDQLRAELGGVEARLQGYARELAGLDPGQRRHRSICAARDADEARADELEQVLIPAAESRIADAEADDGDSTELAREEVDADFAHLAAVGLALMHCEPHGPALLSDAVTWLLDSGQGLHNLRRGENDRQILIDVRVRVPLADGSVEWMDAGTLDLTDRRLSPNRGRQLVDDLARRLLVDGEPMSALRARFGWDAGELLRRVACVLASKGVSNTYLRAAIITSAVADPRIPVARVVVASINGDATMLAALRLEHGDWIVDRIVDAYLADGASWAHGSGWVRKGLAPWRSAMASVALKDAARRGSLVASIDGLRNDEQLKDHLHPGRCSHWQPPLRIEDGWVAPYVCRRDDCPGGGNAPMTGFLPVPELLVRGDAVFCTFCWHSIAGEGPLPDVYRLLWDVGSDNASLGRADGIPFVASGVAVVELAADALRSRDVARDLGISMTRMFKLASSGRVPFSKSKSGKRVYHPRVCDLPAVKALKVHADPTDADSAAARSLVMLDGGSAAAHLGKTRLYLRSLVRSGVVSNRGTPGCPAYVVDELDAVLQAVRGQLKRPKATFADLVPTSELAERWTMTVSTVRHMISEGVLEGVAVGETQLVSMASVDALNERIATALDPSVRLSSDQVAQLAGITAATVLHHATTGALPAVQLYPRGRFYFLPREVDRWLADRAAA